MDPDEALRLCLTEPDTEEGKEAARGLREWLARGGFSPLESIVKECGVTRRRKLPHPHGALYLERVGRSGWAIVITRPEPVIYYRLRRD